MVFMGFLWVFYLFFTCYLNGCIPYWVVPLYSTGSLVFWHSAHPCVLILLVSGVCPCRILARWVKRRNSTQLNEVLCRLVFSWVVVPWFLPLCSYVLVLCCLLYESVFSLRLLSCICLVIFLEMALFVSWLKTRSKTGHIPDMAGMRRTNQRSCPVHSYLTLALSCFVSYLFALFCSHLSCLVISLTCLVSCLFVSFCLLLVLSCLSLVLSCLVLSLTCLVSCLVLQRVCKWV